MLFTKFPKLILAILELDRGSLDFKFLSFMISLEESLSIIKLLFLIALLFCSFLPSSSLELFLDILLLFILSSLLVDVFIIFLLFFDNFTCRTFK